MKRFRFRLQSLLFLRELRETQAATVLAQKLEQQLQDKESEMWEN